MRIRNLCLVAGFFAICLFQGCGTATHQERIEERANDLRYEDSSDNYN